MDGFIFTMFLFFLFVLLMAAVIAHVKGNMAVYLTAVATTLSAWFIGLVLDANLDFPDGFLAFRVLFPILAMGLCILHAVMKNKSD